MTFLFASVARPLSAATPNGDNKHPVSDLGKYARNCRQRGMVAGPAAVSLSSGVPEGAGTLHAMMERLAKAPQRRDFKTVPMIDRTEPATHLVEGPPPLIGLHREGLCDRGTRRVRVALGPFWLFEEGLRSGMLVRVPKRYDAPPVPIYLLYTASHMLLRRVRTFIEFISATFAETAPYL